MPSRGSASGSRVRCPLLRCLAPPYISISFALLAYFESFVVLAGAYLSADAEPRPV